MKLKVLAGAFVAVLVGVVVTGHWYLVRRLALDPALPGPLAPAVALLICGFGASLVAAPVLEHVLGPHRVRPFALAASTWMGVAFFVLVGLLASDLVLFVTASTALADPGGGGEAGTLVARVRAAAAAGFAAFAAGAGAAAVRRPPGVRRREIRLARWPRALDGYRLVQVSDVHLGPLLGRTFAEGIVARVNSLEPDLVAITGDLVDGAVEHLRDAAAPFAGLAARDGVFFVTGNHDYYSGADAWIAELRRLGIRVLRNEHVTLGRDGGRFDLAGVDDRQAWLFGGDHGEDVPRALAGRDPSRAVVLLAHDPGTFRRAARHDVDLQLSGHTHGGQIWPFRYLVRLAVPWVDGHHVVGSSQLYVSRGTGFWGPPMRFLAPAEITELVLRAA
jgi:predicted MPP superfamily phosphohydrolase